VAYTLTDSNKLVIEYHATTDKKTHINLTNHTYFNLKGAGEGNVQDHIMQINADTFTSVDEELIPTGELKAVEGTPSDFRDPKAIGRDIDAADEQLSFARGYDHNFVLNDAPKNEDGLVFAARVLEPKSGRVMEVYTNEPGVQFYGGNFLNGETIGKKGKAYDFRGAFCLETQHFPDSPNKKQFPTTILEPGEEYNSTTVYFFGVTN
jgi:aldose 1-epimerase